MTSTISISGIISITGSTGTRITGVAKAIIVGESIGSIGDCISSSGSIYPGQSISYCGSKEH